MSKPVKEMIVSAYENRMGGQDDALVVSLRGVNAEGTESIRGRLREKEITVQVVKNSLARKAFEGTKLESLGSLMKGQNAVIYGAESVVDVAREIVEIAKEFPDVELKGAVLDGELYEGDDGVERLSKFPTRDEAIATAVTLVLSPARNLLGAVKGPGGRLAGLIKAIEDKLEKGEAISAAS
ncbi:MAG: 50S ribosomal protein L10 [Planctomycetota bacterium]